MNGSRPGLWAYLLLNAFMYLMFIATLMFTTIQARGLLNIEELSIWVIVMLVLLFKAVFMSFKIKQWVREGRL